MGFSISSPDLESLASRMGSADPVAAYHRAAADVGGEFEGDLTSAFEEAGAADEVIDTIGTYIHPNGTAYVGIPGTSRYAATAHDIEYGTPHIPPRAPVRNISAARSYDLGQKMTAALDREMGNEVG